MSQSLPTPAKDDLELLRTELTRNQIRLGDDDAYPQVFLEELWRALFKVPHEGSLQDSCVAICASVDWKEVSKHVHNIVPIDRNLGRIASNGQSSILVVADGEAALVDPKITIANDGDFVALWNTLGKGVIIHQAASCVRVLCQRGIYTCESRRWTHRPHSNALLSKIGQSIVNMPAQRIRPVLDLALNLLSPNKVGATIIIPWTSNACSKIASTHICTSLQDLKLRVSERASQPIIQHVLSQFDGATLLSPEGAVLSTGIHLKPSDRACSVVSQTGGTRHTSSARFSYDRSDVLIVTISADGPVSVFSDGIKLGEVDPNRITHLAYGLANAVPSKAEHMEVHHDLLNCPNCDKSLRVDIYVIYGWREREEAYCPVCGTEVRTASCFQIDAFLYKELELDV